MLLQVAAQDIGQLTDIEPPGEIARIAVFLNPELVRMFG
jgi:hypothetical protein